MNYFIFLIVLIILDYWGRDRAGDALDWDIPISVARHLGLGGLGLLEHISKWVYLEHS